jgi:hypothetical protein
MGPSDFLRRGQPFRLNALSTDAVTAGAIAASGSPWLQPVPSRHTAAAHAGDHVDGVTFVSVAVVAFADTQAARRSHSSALPSIPAEAAMTALHRVPVRCGLPVCPLARDGYWPCVSGMLRRGRLRRHDLPLASWGEGLPSRRTSHLLGTCPTRHAMIPAPLLAHRREDRSPRHSRSRGILLLMGRR